MTGEEWPDFEDPEIAKKREFHQVQNIKPCKSYSVIWKVCLNLMSFKESTITKTLSYIQC